MMGRIPGASRAGLMIRKVLRNSSRPSQGQGHEDHDDEERSQPVGEDSEQQGAVDQRMNSATSARPHTVSVTRSAIRPSLRSPATIWALPGIKSVRSTSTKARFVRTGALAPGVSGRDQSGRRRADSGVLCMVVIRCLPSGAPAEDIGRGEDFV